MGSWKCCWNPCLKMQSWLGPSQFGAELALRCAKALMHCTPSWCVSHWRKTRTRRLCGGRARKRCGLSQRVSMQEQARARASMHRACNADVCQRQTRTHSARTLPCMGQMCL
jgi:hypothetical protein